jgi:hypothetical protein
MGKFVQAIYLIRIFRPLEKGVDCYVDFMDEAPSASSIKKDARALYAALLSACQGGVGCRILMENRWYPIMVSAG